MSDVRVCTCGTLLSRYNPSDRCARCERAHAAEHLPVVDDYIPTTTAPVRQVDPGPANVWTLRSSFPLEPPILCSTCENGRHPKPTHGFSTCACRDPRCACGYVITPRAGHG